MTLQGLEVGGYTLDRLLGQGGMGAVWLGHRTDGRFEGRVAVKLMNLAYLGPVGLERFRREGSVLARLSHPGIARLLDAGVAPTRQPYLVIEYVDGEPIDAFADARSLPAADRIGLVLQVLDALAHAHANLVIHRDIKPSNILVTAGGTVKLLDFGIAKLLDPETGGGPTGLTVEGGNVLTLDFAAPEQVLGEAITTATDVYAVGVLLYLLLSGRHPTAGDGMVAAGLIAAVTTAEPARLGLGDLDSILAKALRKAPEDRYVTATELADDLRRYLQEQPVRARPDSVTYRARKFVRRHRAAVVLGLTTAVLLIGATGFSLVQMRIARTERNEAMRSARRQGAMSELQGVLAADARGPGGAPLSMAGRIERAEQVLTRRFRAEPWIVASVMVDLSGRFFEVGDLPAQRAMLARARSIARQAGLPSELALAVCTRAISFWLEDLIDSARADVGEAKAALAAEERADPEVQAICLEAEGKLLQATGQADSGVKLLERALAVVDADPTSSRQMSVANALAEVLRLSRRTREAVPYFRRILRQLDSMGYADTDAFPNVAGFLSASLIDLGEIAALDSSLGALVRDREGEGGGGRVAPRLAFLYGVGKLYLGAVDSADRWISRAIRDSTESVATLAAALPAAQVELRLEQGRLAEAREAASRLPDTFRGQRATAAMLRARLRHAEGDRLGASALLERELAALWTDGKPRLTLFALPLVTAGEWRLARGDARGADSLAGLARTAAAIDSLALVRSALAGRAELLRARALEALGDRPQARQAIARAVVALENGYGARNSRTLAARVLADSLAR